MTTTKELADLVHKEGMNSQVQRESSMVCILLSIHSLLEVLLETIKESKD